MPDTSIHLSAAQRERLCNFYNRRGERVKSGCCAAMPALGGGGVLASTIDDMSRFLAYNMGLLKTSIDDSLPLLQQRLFQQKPSHYIGLGWYDIPVSAGSSLRMISKNGGISEVSTFITFVKTSKTGVMVLANSNSDTRALGKEILMILNSKVQK